MSEVKVGEFAASMTKAAESSGDNFLGAEISERAELVRSLRRSRMPESSKINMCMRMLRQASDQLRRMRSRRQERRRFERQGVKRSTRRSLGLEEENIMMVWL